jgi:serine protease Do
LVANLFGGPEQPALVVWTAPSGVDLALVRATRLSGAELIPLVPRRAQIGDAIFTVGNPLGYEASYSVGTLSAVRQAHFGSRTVRVFQVQAAINPGNSGGGLYAANGQLLGINTWVANQRIAEGIGFALAIDDVIEVLRQSTPLWQEIERTPADQKGSAP